MGEHKRHQAMSREQFDKLIVGVTRGMADESKLIAIGWYGFDKHVIPSDASEQQRRDMCIAFFAGADHLYSSIMSMLDPGVEETPGDMRRMAAIHDELEKFRNLLKAAAMPTKGTA
jgi:hypothetical protein